ncbi:hypothetical protein H2248_012564 [Termitomyces sp. 'cryptogamus']|nr:hypothetical protein H2248_012564 [Termitomyces sp. 'cryptogamus']
MLLSSHFHIMIHHPHFFPSAPTMNTTLVSGAYNQVSKPSRHCSGFLPSFSSSSFPHTLDTPTPIPSVHTNTHPLFTPVPILPPQPLPKPVHPDLAPVHPPSHLDFVPVLDHGFHTPFHCRPYDANLSLPCSPFLHDNHTPPSPAPLHFSHPPSVFVPPSPFINPPCHTTPVGTPPILPNPLFCFEPQAPPVVHNPPYVLP